MRSIKKINVTYSPREHEVWIPVDMEGVDATEGYFISSEGRVARLHIAPNPYTQAPWIALIPVEPLKGAGGWLVEFTLESGSKKRAMLSTIFIRCFLGEGFLQDTRSFLKSDVHLQPSEINLRNFGSNSKLELHRRYNIMDEEYWVLNRSCGFKIWAEVLGYPTRPIALSHRQLNARACCFYPTSMEEFTDPSGVTWRPIIDEKSNITELECYWISSLGVVVQFSEDIGGPSELLGVPVHIGINCTQLGVRPMGSGESNYVVLRNAGGDLLNKSLRKLVYNVFIDPHYDGKVTTIHKGSGGNGVNLLVPTKK
ncbi:MAG: hypothetical protein ACRC7S_00215 [Cetobacterium sp.]